MVVGASARTSGEYALLVTTAFSYFGAPSARSVRCENVQAVACADGHKIALGVVRMVQDLLVEIATIHAVLARQAKFSLECGRSACR